MTREEFDYLKTDEARRLIEENIEREPSKVALRIRNAAVATQIKNLQKCRTKLPSFYAARCIIPTVSYEQSSSEATAASKTEKGRFAIDLTCGLGVDSFALSKRFDRVVTVEIDPLRAEIARYNFERLGALNVEVICSSAEKYVEDVLPREVDVSRKADKIDLIYIDPSRRSETGSSVYAVEQCHPNVLDMMPDLRQIAHKIVIKLSPLFDVEESFRLFGEDSSCQVVTVNNECKEVVVTVSTQKNADLSVVALRSGVVSKFDFAKEQIGDLYSYDKVEPKYLCVPDVGFYKSRTVSALMQGQRYYYSGGYIITDERPVEFCGSVYEIVEVAPYQPKQLRKRFKQAIVHIRDFPYTLEQIGIRQGGAQHLFFSTYFGEQKVFIVK